MCHFFSVRVSFDHSASKPYPALVLFCVAVTVEVCFVIFVQYCCFCYRYFFHGSNGSSFLLHCC